MEDDRMEELGDEAAPLGGVWGWWKLERLRVAKDEEAEAEADDSDGGMEVVSSMSWGGCVCCGEVVVVEEAADDEEEEEEEEDSDRGSGVAVAANDGGDGCRWSREAAAE
jgi:hypothetical protein